MTRSRSTMQLRVPKRTGSLGDTFIAWGLALLASDVQGRDVELQDSPEAFVITIRSTPEQLTADCARFVPTTRVMLPWLASTGKKRRPPQGVKYHVDRDVLKDDAERIRQRGQHPDTSGDAPAATGHPLADKYGLFQVLTNPGTQWIGYNSFVECIVNAWSPAGVEAILGLYAQEASESELDVSLDAAATHLGLTTAGKRRRNPPGFLFPGANKGPTMRLDRSGTVIGQTSALDWMLADRGDLSAIELYLAYVGYFAFGVVISTKGSRVVAAPVPHRVMVPRILGFLTTMPLSTYPNSPPAQTADVVLAYARVAVEYVAAVSPPLPSTARFPIVLSGVQLGYFWMPQRHTYAVDQVGFAPLPGWLGPLVRGDRFDISQTRETVNRHRRQIRAVGLAKSPEAREAALAYRRSLDGDALAWLRVFPLWYSAVLTEAYVGSWSVREIERIAMALQPDLGQIIGDPAFESLTAALRSVTVQAHYARKDRQSGNNGGASADRPSSRLSPQYDLIGSLREAADRHPDEFLRELCEFVADYNNEAMRRGGRLVRQEDLRQVVAWMQADRRGLTPALLLAFGVSPRRRTVDGLPETELKDDEAVVPD